MQTIIQIHSESSGCDFFFEPTDKGWRWREVGCEYALPLPRLAAPVQLRNAAVAGLENVNRNPTPAKASR